MSLSDYSPRKIDPAKVLFLDIENAPNLGYVWGKYEQTVVKYEHESFMLAVAWRWEHQKRTYVKSLPDFDTYAKDRYDDTELVMFTLGLLDEADIVIGHNVARFDIRKINAYAVTAGLQPPSPYRVVDTLKVARKHFMFNDNKLGALCHKLELDLKEDPGGFETWLGCMAGEKKAWAHMVRYARQDVAILPALYERLRPWMTGHPTVHFSLTAACATCGGDKLEPGGYHHTKTGRYPVWRCGECGSLSRERKSDTIGPGLVSL